MSTDRSIDYVFLGYIRGTKVSGAAFKKSLLYKVGKVKNSQIDNIKNTKIREIANKHVQRSKGDFGMVIEGGVDLEAFANDIIAECSKSANEGLGRIYTTDQAGWILAGRNDAVEGIKNHFGVK